MTDPRRTIDEQLAQSESRLRDFEARLAALPPGASAARTLAESLVASECQLQDRLSALQAATGRRRRPPPRRPVTWGRVALVGIALAAGWFLGSRRSR